MVEYSVICKLSCISFCTASGTVLLKHICPKRFLNYLVEKIPFKRGQMSSCNSATEEPGNIKQTNTAENMTSFPKEINKKEVPFQK